MRTTQLQTDNPRTWAIIFEAGDELASSLERFASGNGLSSSSFKGIGALQDVVLGYFDWERKEYKKIPVREQVEVLSLVGDVALKDGRPAVHAHIVIGKADGTAHGGHLMEAHVRPIVEVILTETPGYLKKEYDPESGLALIRP